MTKPSTSTASNSKINDETSNLIGVILGKTFVGKTSILNSLYNLTHETGSIYGSTASLVQFSVSGIVWNELSWEHFIEEQDIPHYIIQLIKKACIVIFAFDNEPFLRERRLVEEIHRQTVKVPKIMFVNKWDAIVDARLQEHIKQRFYATAKELNIPDSHVLFGSAVQFNSNGEVTGSDLGSLRGIVDKYLSR